MAFKSKSDGISIFDAECGVRASGSICAHIARYYPQGFEEPIIFWQFSSGEILLPDATIEQKTSESGDACHHNITGLSRPASKKIIYGVSINYCSICEDGNIRSLTPEDLELI